jgi:MSHA biogenesis protein MshP
MRFMSTTCPSTIRQRGFAIVSAIFILVVLAGLAGFIVSVTTTQNVSFAQDIQSARAYQAARAGVEWGIHQWLPASGKGTCAGGAPSLGSGDFAGFTVSVTANTSGTVSTTVTSGANGASTIVVSSVSGIIVGMPAWGTGIASGAIVSNIDSATKTLTLSAANTSVVSGTAYFGVVFCEIIGTATTGGSAGSIGYIERQLRAIVESN